MPVAPPWEDEATMYRLTRVVAGLLILGGCATGPPISRVAHESEGYAAPAPELIGTWRGTAFAVPGSLYGTSTPVELTVNPDGTWSWSKRGQEQARGRIAQRGARVDFLEDETKDGEQTIQLQRRGYHLWGVSGGFIGGFPSAVDLRRGSP